MSTNSECVELVEFLLRYPLDEILAATSIVAFHEVDRLQAAGCPETAKRLAHLADVLGSLTIPEIEVKSA
jgi:hypothetical protein